MSKLSSRLVVYLLGTQNETLLTNWWMKWKTWDTCSLITREIDILIPKNKVYIHKNEPLIMVWYMIIMFISFYIVTSLTCICKYKNINIFFKRQNNTKKLMIMQQWAVIDSDDMHESCFYDRVHERKKKKSWRYCI